MLHTIPSRLRYSLGTARKRGVGPGSKGVQPRTRVRLFSYAAAYGLVTRRGEVRVPRNTLGLVIAVLVIILLIYLIFQFI